MVVVVRTGVGVDMGLGFSPGMAWVGALRGCRDSVGWLRAYLECDAEALGKV